MSWLRATHRCLHSRQDPLAEVEDDEKTEDIDLEQRLFGSDDEGDEQDEEQSAPPSTENRRAMLQQLSARKELEKRESEKRDAKGSKVNAPRDQYALVWRRSFLLSDLPC